MKYLKQFQLLLFLFVNVTLFAQFEFSHSNAKNSILGSSAKVSQNTFSIFDNVANTTAIKSFQIGLSAKNTFGIAELNTYFLSIAFNDTKNKFAFGIAQNGFDVFNETLAKIGYARIVNENFSAGFSFNALRQFTQTNQSFINFNFDVAFVGNLSEKLTLATSVKNPLVYQTNTDFTENYFGSVDFAISYQVNKKTNFAVNTYKPIEKPLSVGFGLNYKLVKQLNFLIGFQSNPQIIGLGLNFNFGKTNFSTATSYHQNLFLSPSFDFSFISNTQSN